MKFELGRLVCTRGVSDVMAEDIDFYHDVLSAIQQYIKCDWGITCKEDKQLNDEAINTGDRILAAYMTEHGKIWIITEADRSATTVLFPDEY